MGQLSSGKPALAPRKATHFKQTSFPSTIPFLRIVKWYVCLDTPLWERLCFAKAFKCQQRQQECSGHHQDLRWWSHLLSASVHHSWCSYVATSKNWLKKQGSRFALTPYTFLIMFLIMTAILSLLSSLNISWVMYSNMIGVVWASSRSEAMEAWACSRVSLLFD